MTAGPPATAEEIPDQHQSLALGLLVRRLGDGRRRRVLDLGPAIGGNVAFFAGLSCQVHIADLHQSLFPPGGPRVRPEPRAFEELLARDLPPPEHFELILAWDLLNYLEPTHIVLLARRLEAFSRPGTTLLAMVSTRKEIPDRPTRFEVHDPQHLRYGTDSSLLRPCPQYKEPELSRSMTAFEVESTFLLRNGVQEYLFSYKGRPQQATP